MGGTASKGDPKPDDKDAGKIKNEKTAATIFIVLSVIVVILLALFFFFGIDFGISKSFNIAQ